MSDALLARLEAVASKLEAYANGLPAAGGAPAAAKESKEDDSRAVQAYDEFYSASVAPFVDFARKFPETSYIADLTEQAFKGQRDVIEAAGKCKQPPAQTLMNFVKPISDAMAAAEKKVDNRSAWFNHQKSFAEGIVALGWVANPGASKPVIIGGLEAGDFYLIKILTAAKAKEGDEQANLRGYATSFKDMLNKLADYAHEHHKLGLAWNTKGGDLANFSAGGASDGGAAPPPPGPPPSVAELTASAPVAAAPKPAGGMGNVFDAINKGGSVTAGLKKVSKDQMTHKNPALRSAPGLEPKAAPKPKEEKKPAVAAAAAKKPPSLELQKGTWFCENFENTQVEIPDVELKQSVYISKCKNVQVTIPSKFKGLSVDGCHRVYVTFKSVVSAVEVFNSQRVSVEIEEYCPSVAIDKSDGSNVILTKESRKNPPQIVTSKISESNVTIPGATDDADPIEIPIPEQFITTIGADNKLSSGPVQHGD